MFWRRTQKKTVPTLAEGLRIYAVGDIHGRLDLLERTLRAMELDLHAQPVPDYLMIFLGDYVDRGPESAGVVELLIGLREMNRAVCLKGNHEALMLETLAKPSLLDAWTAVGGLNTLMSYGLTPQSSSKPEEAAALVAAFSAALPDTHLTFLKTLPLSLERDDYFFVHAGIRPRVPLHEQREDDLLWIREEFLLHEAPFDRFIIHGHTPIRDPDVRSNRINIDTGAFATSKLTCLVLEGMTRRFLS